MNCNATLTTATVKPCPFETPCIGDHCVSGLHVGALRTLTCVSPHPHGPVHRWARGDEGAQGKSMVWTDDTPGATPHREDYR